MGLLQSFSGFGAPGISPVDLGLQLGELNGNVRCVAIQHRCIASMDLSRVVQDDDLGQVQRDSWKFSHAHCALG
jgi:hypothetical protein